MRHRGLTEAFAVLAGALVLTAALTYPLVPKLDRVGRVNTDDGRLSIWNVAWVADALIVDPRTLYDANIFYPARNALAFSEANIGAGLLAVPAWGLTGNPFLAHNSVVVLAFVLGVAGAYYLVRYLSGSREAAAVAGVLFGFCPYIFARTAHIQLLMTAGLPFSLLAFHRLVDRPSLGRALALGVVLFAQALSCAYYGIFAGLMVGLGTFVFAVSRGLWRSPRYWALVGAAAAVVARPHPAVLPAVSPGAGSGLRPHARRRADVQRRTSAPGSPRRPGRTAGGSTPSGSSARCSFPVRSRWRLAWPGPGCHRQRSAPSPVLARDVAAFYGLLAVLAFWASFGPDAGLYRVLFETVPVFALLRAPARMGLIVTLSLVVLSSAALAPWLRARRRPLAWTIALVLAAAVELNMAPLTALRDAPPVPEAYRALARLPRGPLAEFPYFARRTDFPRHAEYMLGSTYHWQPLINGYSDFIPGEWRRTAEAMSYFPTRQSFGILSDIGARYVVFHLNGYNTGNRAELIERIGRYQQFLRPLVQQDDVWLYEIVDWPN